MRTAPAALAALLLLPACGGEIPTAPACDDPATVERVLTGVFAAVTSRGASAMGGRARVDREGGFITTGQDTMRFSVAGDTLILRAAEDAPAQTALVLREVRTTELDDAAGASRCEATLDAPYWGGGSRPLRYLSIISPDDEHVVTGAVMGEPEEIPF